MNFRKYIVQEEDNILDVMKKINDNSQKEMYIVKNDQLVGSITDGDIRRYLIKYGNLNTSLKEVYNINPIFVNVKEQIDYKLFMRKKKINTLPIVDDKMRILNIVVLEEEIDYPTLGIPVVIMAGGKGTRLLPYTNILPKPLMPIGEKTITECIMENFEKYGCKKFDMIINYKKNFIKSYFLESDIKRDIIFTEEEEFLGTGGGLKLLKNRYKSTFFMTNCDIIVKADYFKIYERHILQNNIITIVCANKTMILPYGIIDVDENNRALNLKEKPEYKLITNTGFYVIEPEFLDLIPDNTFIHITDIIKMCLEQNLNVGVYQIEDNDWLDIGQVEELKKMQEIMG